MFRVLAAAAVLEAAASAVVSIVDFSRRTAPLLRRRFSSARALLRPVVATVACSCALVKAATCAGCPAKVAVTGMVIGFLVIAASCACNSVAKRVVSGRMMTRASAKKSEIASAPFAHRLRGFFPRTPLIIDCKALAAWSFWAATDVLTTGFPEGAEVTWRATESRSLSGSMRWCSSASSAYEAAMKSGRVRSLSAPARTRRPRMSCRCSQPQRRSPRATS